MIKMAKKPKIKDLLNEVKFKYVGLYNEVMMPEVDEIKELVIKGINNEVGKIYDLLDMMDINNYEELFADYEKICNSLAECKLDDIACDLFDDISILDKKRDALLLAFGDELYEVGANALKNYKIYIPQEKAQTTYKQVQFTFTQEFKRYWRMTMKDLVNEVNESFLLAQSLMLQEVRKLDSLHNKQQLNDTNVVELPTVNKVEYHKITDRKELMELAKNNGFELVRVCGSHHIYRDTNGKITVIPLHTTDIGKGLSHNIQKQILS